MKRRHVICALISSLSLPAFATPVLETLNYARFYSASDPRMWNACQNADGTACQGSVAVPGTNWIAHYNARGSSDYGVLKNYASVSLSGDASGGAFPSFLSVGSRSGFVDEYTFIGAEGAGTAYFIFSIDGNTISRNGAFGNSLFQYVPSRNGSLDWSAVQSFATADGEAVVEVPINFGTPMEMLISFYALAQVLSWQAGASAEADFSHTAILSQIEVRNSAGQLVNDFRIVAASGTQYDANGVGAGAVPEPGSAPLLLAGLGAAAWLRRKRKQAAG